jgi:hypothetical protein
VAPVVGGSNPPTYPFLFLLKILNFSPFNSNKTHFNEEKTFAIIYTRIFLIFNDALLIDFLQKKIVDN